MNHTKIAQELLEMAKVIMAFPLQPLRNMPDYGGGEGGSVGDRLEALHEEDDRKRAPVRLVHFDDSSMKSIPRLGRIPWSSLVEFGNRARR